MELGSAITAKFGVRNRLRVAIESYVNVTRKYVAGGVFLVEYPLFAPVFQLFFGESTSV